MSEDVRERVEPFVVAGSIQRRRRVEAPPADCERFGARTSTSSTVTWIQGDPSATGMEW